MTKLSKLALENDCSLINIPLNVADDEDVALMNSLGGVDLHSTEQYLWYRLNREYLDEL